MQQGPQVNKGIQIARQIQKSISDIFKRFYFAVPIYNLLKRNMDRFAKQIKKIQNVQEILRSSSHIQHEYEQVFDDFKKKYADQVDKQNYTLLLEQINSHSFTIIQVLTELQSMLAQPIMIAEILTRRNGKLLQKYFSDQKKETIKRCLQYLYKCKYEERQYLALDQNQVIQVFEILFSHQKLGKELQDWLIEKGCVMPNKKGLDAQSNVKMNQRNSKNQLKPKNFESSPSKNQAKKQKGQFGAKGVNSSIRGAAKEESNFIQEGDDYLQGGGIDLILSSQLFKDYISVYRAEQEYITNMTSEGTFLYQKGNQGKTVSISSLQLRKLFQKSRQFYRNLKYQTQMDINFKKTRLQVQQFCMEQFKIVTIVQHNFKI